MPLFKFGNRATANAMIPQRRNFVSAALSSNPGIGPNPGYQINRFNIVYDRLEEGSVVEDWVPQDIAGLNMMFRRFHVRDPIAGPCADIWSSIPWSTYEVAGVEDPLIRRFYEDAFNLFTPEFMEAISLNYIVEGRFCGSLMFNEDKGYWTDIIPQDGDFLEFRPISVKDADPLIDMMVSPGTRELLRMRYTDDRVKQAYRNIPEDVLQLYEQGGPIPLDPWATLFVARKAGATDYVGTSMFTRCIPFWAIEKALLNATVIAARRRASGLLHIRAGIDDVWDPDADEMNAIAGSFIQADEDPVGAVVVTRTGVEPSEIRAGGDVWKISDEWSYLQEGKMRALGLSEAFLSAEASYANASEATSIFMEQVRTFRARLTEKTLVKLAIRLARMHGFVHQKQANLDHRIRIKKGNDEILRLNQLSVQEALDLDVNDLILPTIQYTKSLQPQGDAARLDLLTTLEEKGLYIPLRMWAVAGGYDIDDALEMGKDDKELKNKIEKLKGESEEAPEEGEEGKEGEEETEPPAKMAEEKEEPQEPEIAPPEKPESLKTEEEPEEPKEKKEKQKEAPAPKEKAPETKEAKPPEKGASIEDLEWAIWNFGPICGISRDAFYNSINYIRRNTNQEIWRDGRALREQFRNQFDDYKTNVMCYLVMRYGFTDNLPVSKQVVSDLIDHISTIDIGQKEQIWELFLIHKLTSETNMKTSARVNKMSKSFSKLLSAQLTLDKFSSKSPKLVSGI